MLEVKIPIEIHDYKSKLIAGLSVRQLASIGGAMAIAIPIGVLGHDKISSNILPWIIIILTIPWVLFGFVKFQGMNFEDYILSWLRFNFFPQKRVYEDTENSLLQELHEELIEASIQQQHIDNDDYELE
jgi:hypothetical protein